MFRRTLLFSVFVGVPAFAIGDESLNEHALRGSYLSSDGSSGCSLHITGQTKERLGQREIVDIWLTISSSAGDRVQLALKMTGSFASLFRSAGDDNYERVEAARIEGNGTKIEASYFKGATRGANGMIEATVDHATARTLINAIAGKQPVTISVKPTWQRSERAFIGIVDLAAKDAVQLGQCVKSPATDDPRRPR
jgi:hypothetical protein